MAIRGIYRKGIIVRGQKSGIEEPRAGIWPRPSFAAQRYPHRAPARLCGKAGFSDLVGARVSHPRFQSRDFGRVQFRERETPPDYSVRLGMSCLQRQLSQILRQLGTLFLSELFPSIEHDWRTAFICTSKFPSTARSEQEGIQHYSAIPPPFVE